MQDAKGWLSEAWGRDEREFTGKDFLDIEAIHMHYTCKKCGSEIIEEFTLTDVFIDKWLSTIKEQIGKRGGDYDCVKVLVRQK